MEIADKIAGRCDDEEFKGRVQISNREISPPPRQRRLSGPSVTRVSNQAFSSPHISAGTASQVVFGRQQVPAPLPLRMPPIFGWTPLDKTGRRAPVNTER